MSNSSSIPTPILTQLTHSAAKLYLILLNVLDETNSTFCHLPVTELARRAALSPRACWLALRQLQSLKLLERLPRNYHAPNTYRLLSPAELAPATAQPDAHHTTTVHPIAQLHPSTAQPSAHQTTATAQLPSKNPAPSPRIPTAHPIAQLLNKTGDAKTQALLNIFLRQYTTAETALFTAAAQATLAQQNSVQPHSPEPL